MEQPDDDIPSCRRINKEVLSELLLVESGWDRLSDPVEQSDSDIPSRRRLDEEMWLEFWFTEFPRFRLKLRRAVGDVETWEPCDKEDDEAP